MPHHCFENRRSSTELDIEDSNEDDDDQHETSNEDDDDLHETSIWQHAPDLILLHIFSLLDVKHLGRVAQTCKTWRRISLDESLWRDLLCRALQSPALHLAAGKSCWREEMKRVSYHVPEVLTETLTQHTDEVLHVSFSHNGKLFSTTSKDATLKVWEVGYPTRQKYSKDFRELLAWDFTQFSSFNESDTMVLVSSVKSTHLMDRRGYMAILSLIHDFAILRVVTMDPSQLFGAWLDDTTFLGGSLEISLDRFATTVQIEAHEVPEIYSPQPNPPLTPAIEESSGKPLFTFSSETASLIKFLTVTSKVRENNTEGDRENQTEGDSIDKYEEILCATEASESMEKYEDTQGDTGTGLSNVNLDTGTDDLMEKAVEILPGIGTGERMEENETLYRGGTGDGEDKYDTVLETDNVDTVDNKEEILGEKFGQETLDMADGAPTGALDPAQAELMPGLVVENSLGGDSVATTVEEMEIGAESVKCKSRTDSNQQSVKSSLIAHMCGVCIKPMKSTDSKHVCDSCKMPLGECKRPDLLDLGQSVSQDCIKVTQHLKQRNYIEKNLILVTGEFAVALHQIGFKNVPTYSRESVLVNGATPMDADNPEGYMVVNYSNNDIHIVHRQQLLDTPDHLIDLFGHVTGLCLTPDQRYLFINCRPWVGDIDRSDPWATPDLSSNIEVRIIDLCTLKDIGVRYKGHKGFSPPNMCCFVFLDVSADFVASGSEDARGYLWDRHYQTHLRSFEHASGVVNAVGFCPWNQEYLVTVSDDQTIKVWRSRSEVQRLNIQLDSSENVDLEGSDDINPEDRDNINPEDRDNINPEDRDNINLEGRDNINPEDRDNINLEGRHNIDVEARDNMNLEARDNIDLEGRDNIDLEGRDNGRDNMNLVVRDNIILEGSYNCLDGMDNINAEDSDNIDLEGSSDINIEGSDNNDLEGSSNINIEGSDNIDLEGSSNINPEESDNIDLEGSSNINIERSDNIDLEGSSNINIERSDNIDLEGSSNINIEGSDNIDLERSDNIDLEGSSNINIERINNIDLEGSSNINIEGSDNIDLERSDNIDLDGTIHLESSIDNPIHGSD